ncbi:copper resistance protein B [Acinetobacter rathckeae]|uniref:copper resistance protein B n=1 Tax=Acinetobacter rathckeae TaxID=2605272 RepID=UPI0018A2692F|nr:copper resistance protein B [Acinetobacter rathckeae]MBF7688745.1 copper resistance protein B [Acinetobacter rathckeae]MBF7696138.1 copper resistance protein B [Acinetobacter rathckeae]
MQTTNQIMFKTVLSMSLLGLAQLSFAQSHAIEMHHMAEHGDQVYQVTKLSNEWSMNKDGQGTFGSSLESLIGTDENRLFVEASFNKAESHQPNYNVSALYSRNVSDFWDVQAGVKYQAERNNSDSQRVDAVVGILGLAPYFFETKAYVYAGQYGFLGASVALERDFLLTQKLITQPYVDAEFVFRDQSKEAAKSGLSEFKTGIKTRYEINKRVRPFVDVAYAYEKGEKGKAVEKDWRYGLGVELIF